MELLRLSNIRLDYGHRPVLRDVSLRINEGEKVGLIGPNGAGKTSILRLLTGEQTPLGGAITRAPNLRIGYVPQHVEHDEGATVLETVLREHAAASAALHAEEERLASATGDALDAAMESFEAARLAYEAAGGDALPSRAIAMLDALGLQGRGEQRVGALSGGERNVLSLTQALLAEPDLLLLDEPGNHLDFAGIAWLEGFLAGFRGAVLLVSHNRYLLDRVVGRIVHVHDGVADAYTGNYSDYRLQQLRAKLSQQSDYVIGQRRIAQLEEVVRRFRDIAQRTGDPAWGKRLRARVSQLEREREQATEKPASDVSHIRMRFTADRSRADVALQVRDYSKSFGDVRLFDGASMEIAAGERVALLGPNGSGKTTLLRDIVAEGAWDHHALRVGPSLRVGYCAQQQEVLDDDRTVLTQMQQADATLTRGKTVPFMMQFMFGPDDMDKRVGDLSGGERNRLQLARLMTQQPDFLILDEPTNHLDIPSCEAIEDALAEFKGTILVVSHDRYFIDKVADRVVEVRDGQFASYEGNFSEYWAERVPPRSTTKARVATRRAQRERPAPERRAGESARSKELRERIEDAEREKLALEKRVSAAFTRGDHREGTKIATSLEEHRRRIDRLYQQWVAEDERAAKA